MPSYSGRPQGRKPEAVAAESSSRIHFFEVDQTTRLSTLPLHHRDPFDRMLLVQGQGERLPILSADPKLSQYDIEVLW